MKKINKALASLAIGAMALTLIPLNVLAEGAVPTRLGGYTAAQTAVQIAEQTGWTGTAILASSASYGMVDALTAGPLATFLNAPILLTEAGAVLNADTKAELTKLNVKTVYVTSGTGVISQAILDQLKGMGITVAPLGGVDRFATSANIANKMVTLGAKVNKVAVAYGWKNQDALSIASIASAQTEPILLTEKDSIPASVQEFLAANPSVKTTDVIGGTGVISDRVMAQFPSATRNYGNTAYDTNLAVLKAFDSVLKYDHVFIANGETAIDALAGAPLAAKYKAGIVLTNGAANDGTTYVSGKLSANSVVTALGGTAVVPDVVRTGIVYTAPAVVVGGGGGGGYGPSNPSTPSGVSTTTYDTAGTKGPDTGVQTVTGNVQITAAGVKLQNLSITGNLEIAASVGSGEVYLDNVTVAGQTIVKGGGLNSIHIKNSNLHGTLIVIKQGDQVRIVAEGSTSIPNVQLQSGVILQNTTGSNTAFGQVTVTTFTGSGDIELEGDFSSVTLDAPGVTISVPSGTVSAMTLGQNAAGSLVSVSGGTVSALTIPQGVSNTSVTMSSGTIGQLNIQASAAVQVTGGTVTAVTVASTATGTTMAVGSGATVSAMTLNAGTTVTGTGAIGTVVITANGTTIAQTPASTTVGNTVTDGASVGGHTVQATPVPTVTSIISSTGATVASINATTKVITVTPNATTFRQPNIKLNAPATMKLIVNRSGTSYDLGSWNLTDSANGNDIFSASNAQNLDIMNTLKLLKDTGATSSQIFKAIDFHALLTATQSMTPENKNTVYTKLADIFTQAQGGNASTAFYQALNLPGIYVAADINTRASITDIVAAAIPTTAGVTAPQLLDTSTSANAVQTLSTNGNMAAFFSNLDFKKLINALSVSSNKDAVFTAINFTALFAAVDTLPASNKLYVYLDAASIYQAALTISSGGNAINYGELLLLVMTSSNTMNMSLTNLNGTTSYTIVKGTN